MTLEDVIAFLETETERQTLTAQAIRRCILLAYEMGHEAGRQEPRPQEATP